MRKKILAGIVASTLSIGAMAADTTVDMIWVKADKTVLYLANGKACNIGENSGMTAEYAKRFVATVLTAKTSGATVNVNIEGANCKNIFIK